VELISGNFSPSLKFLTLRNQKTVIENLSLPQNNPSINTETPSWVSNSNGFLGLIVTPLTESNTGLASTQINGGSCPSRVTVIDAKNDLYPAVKFPGYELQLPLKATSGAVKYRVFAGPYQDDVLQLLDETFKNPQTGKTPRYISAISFQGWFTFISEPFAKFLFILMKLFHKITHLVGLFYHLTDDSTSLHALPSEQLVDEIFPEDAADSPPGVCNPREVQKRP
jgi:YidC/Oxa1 family membrane protein insertase